jgi:NAD(P)-dependent dehydrogenase (short-subunit alcohol dehydrogenase family)
MWLESANKELGQLTETLPIKVDVRDEESVKNMVDQTLQRFGQIDVLINDAAIVPHFAWGIPRWPRIQDMDKEFWDRVIETNLGGTFLCTKHVARHMVERKSGHIINLYGGGGLKPAGSCAYAVTKDAIRTFTRFVAEEVREANVCVVIFSPRVPIATEGAPEEALSSLARPEILGNGFVLAAQTPMELSGEVFSFQDGKLVNQA